MWMPEIIKEVFKCGLMRMESITGSGSARRYSRLYLDNGSTVILCESGNISENKTFILLTRVFQSNNVPVPQIFWVSENVDAYLQEDLGKHYLLDYIKGVEKVPEGDSLQGINEEVIRELVRLQRIDERDWQPDVEFPPVGADLIWHDFNYCIENFFEPNAFPYNRERVKGELGGLYEKLMGYPSELWGFMYRDFQSRNIMMKAVGDNHIKPYFIDYQSGRKGPGIYDMVSFLWQAKAGFSDEERNRLLGVYAKELAEYVSFPEELIFENAPYWALFRMLQTLGAYGLRGLKEGKKHFIESIPPALNNISVLIVNNNLEREFRLLSYIIFYLKEKYEQ